MKGYKRHKAWFRFLRNTLLWIFIRIFRLRMEPFDTGGEPSIVLANHTSNFDPILVAAATREHMYYVASEHLLRKGITGRLLNWVFAPIFRVKGGTDAQAAMGVLRAVRGKANVCIFPEGSRPFDGVTLPIYPATGKLVRSSKAQLITYKIKGGYFSNPRWSPEIRRGRITGEVAGIYSPAQLQEKTPEEINALIARDLYEDAYETQREAGISYRGKRAAEYLQSALYLCPHCGALDTLHTKGDTFWCACGLHGIYDEKGMLSGEHLRFGTLRDWCRWQREQLPRLAEGLSETCFSDEGFTLYEITARGRDKVLAKGRLTMTRQQLSCASVSVLLDEIAGFAIIGRDKLVFSSRGRHYELRPDRICCTIKYLEMYEELTRKGVDAAKR